MSFRITEEERAEIEELARGEGLELSSFVRKTLFAAMRNERQFQILNELDELRRIALRTKRDVAISVETLLLNLLSDPDAEAVRELVGEVFERQGAKS